MYTYNLPFIILINNRALKSSKFKINAILDFARFLFSGCLVENLGFIFGGFAVVVCVRGVFYGVLSRGVLSGGVLSGGFCPGGFVRGVLSGGFCPGGFVRGVLSAGFCPREVLSRGFCPGGFVRGGFVGGGGGLSRRVLSIGGFCPAGYCPGGFVRVGFFLES